MDKYTGNSPTFEIEKLATDLMHLVLLRCTHSKTAAAITVLIICIWIS